MSFIVQTPGERKKLKKSFIAQALVVDKTLASNYAGL
jgi:hypothetical protein